MPIDGLFHASFQASPIGQYLLAPTDKLEILAVNDAFLRAVSRRRENVVGRPLFEVFPNNPAGRHPRGRPRGQCPAKESRPRRTVRR